MRSSLTYSFQCDIAAVEVDPDTGRVHVRRYVIFHDAGTHAQSGGGRRTDPRRLRAWLRRRDDGDGLPMRRTARCCPARSRIISARPRPELPELSIGHMASPSPNTVQGAKGLGDGCSMIAPAALGNAIADAIGLQDLTPPFLPGRLWLQMQGRDPDASRGCVTIATLKGALRGEGKVEIDAPRETVWAALLVTREPAANHSRLRER